MKSVGTVGTAGTIKNETNAEVRKSAKDLRAQGFSIFPVLTDTTKAPAGNVLPNRKWGQYRLRLPQKSELDIWYPNNNSPAVHGIAIVGGEINGGLEILDIDSIDLAVPVREQMKRECPGLFDRLLKVKTPRPGLHCYYCVEHGSSQCRKLALRPYFDPVKRQKKVKTLIETKGQGGYVLAPGCPGSCHETGRIYKLLKGPGFDQIPVLTQDEHEALLRIARSFDEQPVTAPAPRRLPKVATAKFFDKPWDDFNARADWADILGPHGWVFVKQLADGTEYWRRPGKRAGWSATIRPGRTDRLNVFSQNVKGFEDVLTTKKTYSKFDAFMILNYHGDFDDALWKIKKMGYGQSPPLEITRQPSRSTHRKSRRRRRK